MNFVVATGHTVILYSVRSYQAYILESSLDDIQSGDGRLHPFWRMIRAELWNSSGLCCESAQQVLILDRFNTQSYQQLSEINRIKTAFPVLMPAFVLGSSRGGSVHAPAVQQHMCMSRDCRLQTEGTFFRRQNSCCSRHPHPRFSSSSPVLLKDECSLGPDLWPA
jgi:hypothetical protein